jgi:hypothetical protein
MKLDIREKSINTHETEEQVINEQELNGYDTVVPVVNSTDIRGMKNDEDIIGTMGSNNEVDWYRVRFDYDGKVNFYIKPMNDDLNIDISLFKGNKKTIVGFSGNGPGSHELITIYNAEKGVDYFLKAENKGKYHTDCMKYLARCRLYPYISKNINIVKYQQQNIRWGCKQLDCKGCSIRTDGCYLVCGAMVLDETPKKHYEHLKNKRISNCPYPIQDIATLYEKKYKSEGKRDGIDRLDFLKSSIFYYVYMKSIPVIVRLHGSRGTHFVLVTGFDGNISSNKKGLDLEDIKADMFKVNDPGYIDNKTLADSLGKEYEKLTHIEVMY